MIYRLFTYFIHTKADSFPQSLSLTLKKPNQSMRGKESIYQWHIFIKYNFCYNIPFLLEYIMCMNFKTIILIHTKYIKNTEHHYRWNMHMKSTSACMTHSMTLWDWTSVQHNHSQLTKFTDDCVPKVWKILPFLTWQLCEGVDKRH